MAVYIVLKNVLLPFDEFSISNVVITGCPVFWQEGILASSSLASSFLASSSLASSSLAKLYFSKQLFGKAVI